MAVDVASLGIAAAAVITAAGAMLTGVMTGRAARSRDQSDATLKADAARLDREKIEDQMLRQRITDYQTDFTAMRTRMRENEEEYFKQTRELRVLAQHYWECAQYHFGLVSALAHLWNNVLHVVEAPHATTDLIASTARTQSSRYRDLGPLPVGVEDIPTRRNMISVEKGA